MKKPIAAALSCLMLAACVGPTPYEAKGSEDRRFGYAEQPLDGTHTRVTFRGNAQTPRDTVENYLLYRAAELTATAGHRYFIVTRHDTDKDTSYTGFADPTFAGGFGTGGFGYPGWYGGGAVIDETPSNEYAADMTITMSDTRKPDDPNAYDANDVLKTLGQAIQRPVSQAQP